MVSEKQGTVVKYISSDGSVDARLSFEFSKQEHALGWWDAMRLHYPAIGWGIFMNLVSEIISYRDYCILMIPGNCSQRHRRRNRSQPGRTSCLQGDIRI